jgi:hypothetical protein
MKRVYLLQVCLRVGSVTLRSRLLTEKNSKGCRPAALRARSRMGNRMRRCGRLARRRTGAAGIAILLLTECLRDMLCPEASTLAVVRLGEIVLCTNGPFRKAMGQPLVLSASRSEGLPTAPMLTSRHCRSLSSKTAHTNNRNTITRSGSCNQTRSSHVPGLDLRRLPEAQQCRGDRILAHHRYHPSGRPRARRPCRSRRAVPVLAAVWENPSLR